jgi:membrane protease YdiL (CAAX protease family)
LVLRNRLFWLAATAVVCAAAAIHVGLYQWVRPAAALRLSVTRHQAAEIASDFLSGERGELPGGYRRAVTFDVYYWDKAYLEQTLGLETANDVLQTEGMVYRWTVRWFKPGEQEEFSVELDPDGRLLSYSRYLPDDEPAPESSRPEQVAREFVQRVAGIDVGTYDLQDSYEMPLPNRTEYGYTWERPDLKLGEAKQRLSIVVTGDEVIYFDRFLWTPESFGHQFAKEQEKGDLLSTIAGALAAVLGVVGLVAIVRGLKRRTLHWRASLPIAAAVAVVSLANELNALPLSYAYFDVSQTEFSFLLDKLLYIAGGLAGGFLAVVGLVAAAEWVNRSAWPARLPVSHWFTRAGIGSRSGLRRIAVGYVLGALHLAYVAVFYFVSGRYLGAWLPAEVPYDDLHSTTVPWAYALLIGVAPAVSEEFIFRVLAISWLKRLLRRQWLAVLIPAILWGFLHCDYPNKPFYIRGLELTIWGVVLGWAFTRFGVLPGLIAHAAYNSILVGETFLASVYWVPKLNFLAVLIAIASPLMLSLWLLRRAPQPRDAPGTNWELDQRLQILARKQPRIVPLRHAEPEWRPLPRRSWLLGAAALAVGGILVGIAAWLERTETEHSWRKREVSAWHADYIARRDAVRIARESVEAEGAQIDDWVRSVQIQERGIGDDARSYLSQFLSTGDVDALAKRMGLPGVLWEVSWQKPLERDEWRARILADGKLWDVSHFVPEEAARESLGPEEARALAEEALGDLGLDLSHFSLTGSRQYEYPQRTLHIFTWEPTDLTVGEAQFETLVGVDGDRVNFVQRRIDVPESYLFDLQRDTPVRALGVAVETVMGMALFFWAAATFFGAVRRYEVDWRWGWRIGAALGGLTLVLLVLTHQRAWHGLSATASPAGHLLGVTVGALAGLLVFVGMTAALLPVITSLWKARLPDVPSPRFWLRAIARPWQHKGVWREALLAQVVVWALVLSLFAAHSIFDSLLSRVARGGGAGVPVPLPEWVINSPAPPSPPVPENLTDLVPPLAALVSYALGIVIVLLSWLTLIAFGKAMFRRLRTALICFVVVAIGPVALQAFDWRELLSYLVATLLVAVGIRLSFPLVLRSNPLALAGGLLTIVLAVEAEGWAWYPAHRVWAVCMMAAAAALVLWALVSTIRAGIQVRRTAPAAAADGAESVPDPNHLDELPPEGDNAAGEDEPTARG